MLERLSYDAWGKRRNADGSDDPSGSITSQTSRGFTGHEELDSVGLVHMNGRVYDPLLARFGTADPTTESPFSTQGWNRYSYVGNSPLNFTDPSGYCFMGCFWKSAFRAIGNFFRQNWGAIVQIAAAAICSAVGGPGLGSACGVIATTIITGITSGDLGMALRAGFIAAVTAVAFDFIGTATAGNFLAKVAGHAAVGCLSAVASGGKCGPGALAAGVSAAGTPLIDAAFRNPQGNFGDMIGGTVASSILGGLGSVAGGGKFANGAVMGAFGYLFNRMAHCEAGTVCNRGGPHGTLDSGIGGGGYAWVWTGWAVTVADFLSLLAAPLNDNTPVHGNTLESPRSTWVYRLHDTDDPEDTLKYGITSRKPPESRYSPAYYMDNEAAMERIMLFPNRA